MTDGFVAQTETTRMAGFEVIYFEVGVAAWSRLVEENKDNKRLFDWALIGHCSYLPRPLPGEFDIVEVGEVPHKPGTVGITLRLRRGHYQLSEFIHMHAACPDFTIDVSWKDELRAHCLNHETTLVLPYNSFPSHDFTLLPRQDV